MPPTIPTRRARRFVNSIGTSVPKGKTRKPCMLQYAMSHHIMIPATKATRMDVQFEEDFINRVNEITITVGMSATTNDGNK
jgi:hypothetical protein